MTGAPPTFPALAARREAARGAYLRGAEAARDPRHSAEHARELLRPLGDAWAREVAAVGAAVGDARVRLEGERATLLRAANAPLTAADAPAVAAVYGLALAQPAPEPRGDIARRAIAEGDTFTLRVLVQAPPSLDLVTATTRQEAERALLAVVHGERFDTLEDEARELERLADAVARDALEVRTARMNAADGPAERHAIEAADVAALIASQTGSGAAA